MENEKLTLQMEIENSMNKMTSHVNKLMDQTSISGANLFNISERKRFRPVFSEKVFELRDSLLTESTKKGKEAHTVFNIFVAILILIYIKIFVHDTLQRGYTFIDFSLVSDLQQTVYDVILLWVPLYLFSFSIVFLTFISLSLKLGHSIYLVVYAVLICVTIVYPIYSSLVLNNSAIGGLILT